MTTKQAQDKLKPFIKQCEKDKDMFYIIHHDNKNNKLLAKTSINDAIAVEVLVNIIANHPEAFNYVIDEMNKKKVIGKA